MIIDTHCHIGYSAWKADPAIHRFSFEPRGAQANPEFDSYFSRRVLRKWGLICRWWFARQALGVDWRLGAGPALDAQIKTFNERHMLGSRSVDRIVLLAFDEYHDDQGLARGPVDKGGAVELIKQVAGGGGGQKGTDLYASNSLVRSICAANPEKFLFGCSVHPYRTFEGRDAAALLPELKGSGAVLVKWLPLHMNIRASDPRTIAMLRKAYELNLTMLIHYGGEATLALQHPEYIDPVEMLGVLRRLRREGCMPKTIIAHVATPSTRFNSSAACRRFIDALTGEFHDAPLYADISGMSGPGRARWLIKLSRRRETHSKLIWATDFPIPPFATVFWPWISAATVRRLRKIPSWFDRDLALKRALGFDEGVFERGADVLGLSSRAS